MNAYAEAMADQRVGKVALMFLDQIVRLCDTEPGREPTFNAFLATESMLLVIAMLWEAGLADDDQIRLLAIDAGDRLYALSRGAREIYEATGSHPGNAFGEWAAPKGASAV